MKYRNLTYFVVWVMLVSAFAIRPETTAVKGDLGVKESQSVLTFNQDQSIDGLYFNTSDFNNPSGRNLFFDNFVSSEDLTQQQTPTQEFFFRQYLFARENQKRTGLRFFAYLKN